MSYSGYEVRYCINGHQGPRYDAFDIPELDPICPLCKEFMDIKDCVDTTNGPGKEKITKINGYDFMTCPDCKDGFVKIHRLFKTNSCNCKEKGKISVGNCSKCFGRGVIFVPDETTIIEMACRKCNGVGKIAVPVYDLTPFGKKFIKSYLTPSD